MKKYRLLFLLSCSALLSGCWGKSELPDLGLVTAIAIDLTDEGELKGSFQMANPKNIAGSLQGGSVGEGSATTVYTSKGKNVADIIRNTAMQSSRKLYFAHTNLIVISEEVARQYGLKRILEPIDRDIEFRTTTKMVIAHGVTAEDILEVETSLDRIPSNKVIKTLHLTEENHGEYMSPTIQEVIDKLVLPGKEIVIPGFTISGDVEKSKSMDNMTTTSPPGILHADGMGLFKDDKLIHWIKGEESKGVNWVLDKMNNTMITVDWEEEDNAISFNVKTNKVKKDVVIQNGKPEISLEILVEGDIREVAVPINIEDRNIQKKVQKNVEDRIKEQIQSAIDIAKENKADILGLGDVIYREHPKIWKMLAPTWNDEHLLDLQVQIRTEAHIRRTGLRNIPFLYQMDSSEN